MSAIGNVKIGMTDMSVLKAVLTVLKNRLVNRRISTRYSQRTMKYVLLIIQNLTGLFRCKEYSIVQCLAKNNELYSAGYSCSGFTVLKELHTNTQRNPAQCFSLSMDSGSEHRINLNRHLIKVNAIKLIQTPGKSKPTRIYVQQWSHLFKITSYYYCKVVKMFRCSATFWFDYIYFKFNILLQIFKKKYCLLLGY